MKKIILSSDGTGSRGGTGYDTNVWKLHTAINQRNDHTRYRQIAYYHDGVGTEDLKLLKILGGATGWGMRRIIIELYLFLVNNYSDGDQIYLFGFSRGAYAVRMLAGFIISCGILKRNKERHYSDAVLKKEVESLYKEFLKQTHNTKDARQLSSASYLVRKIAGMRKYCRDTWYHYKKEKTEFCINDKKHVYPNRKIQFIGAWDTVDAYAIPSDRVAKLVDLFLYTSFREYDNQLSASVLSARHALSIDEHRQVFSPVLWRENHQDLKQVWFAGVHANIGGGYPKQGLAWISLEWMMSEIAAVGDKKIGIEFSKEDHEQYYENKTIYDKLYNSRSGFAVLYMHRSRHIGSLYERYIACENNRCDYLFLNGVNRAANKPRIHLSVFERILSRVEGYAPMNLPADFEIEATQTANDHAIATSDSRQSIQKNNIKTLRSSIVNDLQQLTGDIEKRQESSRFNRLIHFLKEQHIYCTPISVFIVAITAIVFYFIRNGSVFSHTITLFVSVCSIITIWVFSHYAHKAHINTASALWRKIIAGKSWYFLKKKK
jgi:uncharacterized protein (DUF2235 family)